MGGKPRRTRQPLRRTDLYEVEIIEARRGALQHGYLSQLRRLTRFRRQQMEKLNADGSLLTLMTIVSLYRECASVGFAGPAEFELEKEGLSRYIFKDTDQT